MGVSVTPREAGKIARANRVRLPRIGICVRLQNGSELCHDHRGYYIPGFQADYSGIAGLPDRHRSSNPRRRKSRRTRRKNGRIRLSVRKTGMPGRSRRYAVYSMDRDFGKRPMIFAPTKAQAKKKMLAYKARVPGSINPRRRRRR